MNYCSIEDITAEINSADLIAFLDDENTQTLNLNRLNTIIARESAKIDGRLSNIYNTPFNPVPPAVRDACTIFCVEALWRRRLVPDEKIPVHAEAEELRQRFLDIGAGKLELDVNFPRAFSQGAVVQAPILINSNTL